MPIMSGLAIGALVGAGVGGASAALQHKDIGQGALYGGLMGAATGGIGGAMGGAGSAAAGTLTGGEAATFMGSTALPTSMAPALEYGIPSLIDGGASMPLNESAQLYADTPMSGNIASGFNSLASDPLKFMGDNKTMIGAAALGGSMANTSQPNQSKDATTYQPYTYSAGLNPGYTGAGTPYFNQSYTKLPTYTAANGGIMSLAEGGDTTPSENAVVPVKKLPPKYTTPVNVVPQAVQDYNNMLMQRAQNEYVNSPQLGAFTSHFNDPVPLPPNSDTTNMLFQKYLGRDADPTGYAANKNATAEQIAYGIQTSPEYMKANPNAPAPVAPVSTGPAIYTYNPATRGYITSFAPAEPKAANLPAGIAALNQQDQQRAGWNADQGGGVANGGLMRSYALGGGIGSSYGGPDTDTHYDNGGALGFDQGMQYPMQGTNQNFAAGGISNLGSYSDGGRLLRGPGDGVSDDIPAQIGQHQPARLADGEFVVPARIVSELGNGSTDAGAKRLYSMMDRVQANRSKTVGKGKVAVNSRSDKYLPA